MRSDAAKDIDALRSRVAQLQAERDTAVEEARQLRKAFSVPVRPPSDWRLSQSQEALLGALATRDMVSRAMALHLVEPFSREAATLSCVYVCFVRLRAKLAARGIAIENACGRGWFIQRDDRARLQELLADAEPA